MKIFKKCFLVINSSKNKNSQFFKTFFFSVAIVPTLTLFAVELPAETQPVSITGKDGAVMLRIPSGEFLMGNNGQDFPNIEKPQHKVYTDAFYIDKYEVTNNQFSDFLNTVKPSEGRDGQRWKWVVLRSDLDTEDRKTYWATEISLENNIYESEPGYERHPVHSVSWYAADAYCKWAGKRLPTEAEWEKAARGKLEGRQYPWGDEIPTGGVIFGREWIDNKEPSPTSVVGNYYPNDLGIYDMVGNVWEWCSDWYSGIYYKDSPRENPKGPAAGVEKVHRGGGWINPPYALRVGNRGFDAPDALPDGVGFRCAKDAADEKK